MSSSIASKNLKELLPNPRGARQYLELSVVLIKVSALGSETLFVHNPLTSNLKLGFFPRELNTDCLNVCVLYVPTKDPLNFLFSSLGVFISLFVTSSYINGSGISP